MGGVLRTLLAQAHTEAGSTVGKDYKNPRQLAEEAELAAKIKQLGINITWDVYGIQPMVGAVKTAATVATGLGCIWLIGILGFTLLVNLLMRTFHIHRFYHYNEEISLMIAHILILLVSNKFENRDMCALISASINYFFGVEAVFLILEGIHIYTNSASCVDKGSLFGYPTLMAIGWGIPLVHSTLTFAFFRDKHPSPYICWINFTNDSIILLSVLSFIFAHLICLSFTEAGGMNQQRQTPMGNAEQRVSAQISRSSMLIVVILNILSWLFGAWAVHYQDIRMVGTVLGVNIALGVAIFVFHTLSEPKVHRLIGRAFKAFKKKCSCCKKKRVAQD